jgi:tyrosyl-DNA phosphodiesterase-1
MLILLRHDDTAQVVIHTANMISRDWGNMTQAVWRSPLLPLLKENITQPDPKIWPLGTGLRFKMDLIRYLEAYGNRLRDLPKQLALYDFSAVRAAFIGSTPSRLKSAAAAEASGQTSWGWPSLRNILSSIPISPAPPGAVNGQSAPNVVIQISSIATLGQTPSWLTHFQSVLSAHSSHSSPNSSGNNSVPSSSSARVEFFQKRDPTPNEPKTSDPIFHIIFPTADEIRTSLDGYDSGASIHTKTQSATQKKQLAYLQPLLRHWKPISNSISDPTPGSDRPNTHVSQHHRRAERGSAAPHIKTYIRFSDAAQTRIDWAMLTSANLSKQAWGEVRNTNGEVWVQSWEAGVVVWPALFGENASMVPVFGRDGPGEGDVDVDGRGGREGREVGSQGGDGEKTVVGFRMPYNLPLQPYKMDEVPWVASASYEEPDRKGQYYGGFQPH